MKYIPIIAIQKAIISEIHNLISENKNYESNNSKLNRYLNLIKESDILLIETNIYDELLNAEIKSENIALSFINETLSSLNRFNRNDYDIAHTKINNIINENEISSNDLYDNINILIENQIYKNLNNNKKYKIIESIIQHIQTDKNSNVETIDESETIDDDILKIAERLHESTISQLNETDRNLYNELLLINNKKEYFEKKKNIINEKFNQIDDEDILDKISIAQKKLNEMSFNDKSFVDDLIKLHKLENYL